MERIPRHWEQNGPRFGLIADGNILVEDRYAMLDLAGCMKTGKNNQGDVSPRPNMRMEFFHALQP